jgi:uncharacterized protein YfeS
LKSKSVSKFKTYFQESYYYCCVWLSDIGFVFFYQKPFGSTAAADLNTKPLAAPSHA